MYEILRTSGVVGRYTGASGCAVCRFKMFVRCTSKYLKENVLKVSAQTIQDFGRVLVRRYNFYFGDLLMDKNKHDITSKVFDKGASQKSVFNMMKRC